jgi:hypothetical protein
MRFWAHAVRAAYAAVLLLTLSGCVDPRTYNRGVEINSHLVKTETVTDPVTGDVKILSTWKYDNGYTTVTEDRFDKDTPPEQRRATSRAPVVTVDIP